MNSFPLTRSAPPTEFLDSNPVGDRIWIAAAQRGDILSFNQLVRAYQDLAYRIAHHVLDNSDSAIQATQNAFLAAHKAIRQCPRDSFRIWFLKILLQECKSSERAAWTHPAVHAAQASPLQIGLATIPFDDRVVCVLSDMIGLPDPEIASVTRTPAALVREQRNRARRQLTDVIHLL